MNKEREQTEKQIETQKDFEEAFFEHVTYFSANSLIKRVREDASLAFDLEEETEEEETEEEELSVGAFGKVTARSVKVEGKAEKVAVKELSTENHHQKLAKEGAAQYVLHQLMPDIVPKVYGFVLDKHLEIVTESKLVMEWIEGKTVFSWCVADEPTIEAKIEVLAQIAHYNLFKVFLRIEHYDIHQRNVMIIHGKQGVPTVKVIDYGRAERDCDDQRLSDPNGFDALFTAWFPPGNDDEDRVLDVRSYLSSNRKVNTMPFWFGLQKLLTPRLYEIWGSVLLKLFMAVSLKPKSTMSGPEEVLNAMSIASSRTQPSPSQPVAMVKRPVQKSRTYDQRWFESTFGMISTIQKLDNFCDTTGVESLELLLTVSETPFNDVLYYFCEKGELLSAQLLVYAAKLQAGTEIHESTIKEAWTAARENNDDFSSFLSTIGMKK